MIFKYKNIKRWKSKKLFIKKLSKFNC